MSYVTTKQLNLNIEQIKNYCLEQVSPIVTKKFSNKLDNRFIDSSVTTSLHSYYNLLLFPHKELHKLYFEIRDMFNSVNVHDDQYYISMWFNVHHKGQYLDWHSHNLPEQNAYHGYFAVNSEPSNTYYKINNVVETVQNKNNQLVLSRSNGDEHRVSIWEQETPRITLAFDIIPCTIARGSAFTEGRINNWIPI